MGGARPSEVRALRALLYWPSWTADLALLMLVFRLPRRGEPAGEDDFSLRLKRDLPLAKASDHRETRSPADHLRRRDFTSCRISRQRRRCPAAGLASTHLGSMKSLDHCERSAVLRATAQRQSLSALAQQSLAPFGTCWSVGVLD